MKPTFFAWPSAYALPNEKPKKARNIVKSGDGYITTTINIPAHIVPSFKPSKKFIDRVKKNNHIWLLVTN